MNSLKKNRSGGLLFKVDFEKAFDCVDWNYLDFVMSLMGFCPSWRGWILQCISSTSIFVLINGSLTSQFQMKRGLRQGCPLSHFLFYLVVESLSVLAIRLLQLALLLEPKSIAAHYRSHIFNS